MPLTDRQQLIKDIFIAYLNNFEKFLWKDSNPLGESDRKRRYNPKARRGAKYYRS